MEETIDASDMRTPTTTPLSINNIIISVPVYPTGYKFFVIVTYCTYFIRE